MVTIHKFTLPVHPGKVELTLPAHSRFLTLAVQHGIPVAYFEVDSTQPNTIETFWLYETGREHRILGHYRGTVLLLGDRYVLHLYKV